MDKADNLKFKYESLAGWIEKADTKAEILIGVQLFILGYVIEKQSDSFSLSILGCLLLFAFLICSVLAMGKDFHPDFKPELTPKQMLALGVFGGRYMRDCKAEFPASWFAKAKLHPLGQRGHDKALNFFKVNASQPLNVWLRQGWIDPQDPRGWFQWYCRYYMGRRSHDDDRQIRRWKAMRRHISQLQKNCFRGDWSCRPIQRQALLHWAYDSREL
jgi:hypothetical protein